MTRTILFLLTGALLLPAGCASDPKVAKQNAAVAAHVSPSDLVDPDDPENKATYGRKQR